MQRFLDEYMPRWGKFNIVDKAKYLGFWLGPAATAGDNHREPFKQFAERAIAIAGAPHSNAAAILAYNRDAISVTSYVSQCVEMPTSMQDRQHQLIASVMKLPFLASVNKVSST